MTQPTRLTNRRGLLFDTEFDESCFAPPRREPSAGMVGCLSALQIFTGPTWAGVQTSRGRSGRDTGRRHSVRARTWTVLTGVRAAVISRYQRVRLLPLRLPSGGIDA